MQCIDKSRHDRQKADIENASERRINRRVRRHMERRLARVVARAHFSIKTVGAIGTEARVSKNVVE